MENNNKILIYAVLGIVVILVLVGGGMLYVQQQQIKELKAVVNPGDVQAVKGDEIKKINETLAEQSRKDIIDDKKDIMGVVKSVSGDIVVIEAQISDVNVLKTADLSKPMAVPIVLKTYTVKKDSKTITEGIIKVGELVRAFSNSSIYDVDSFTAIKLVAKGKGVPTQPKQTVPIKR